MTPSEWVLAIVAITAGMWGGFGWAMYHSERARNKSIGIAKPSDSKVNHTSIVGKPK